MSFSLNHVNPTPEAATAENLREATLFLEAVLRNGAGLDNAQRMLLGEAEGNIRQALLSFVDAHRAPAATRVVFRCCEQWGDASFESLEELEAAINEVCRLNPGEFTVPEDGLREGRDYVLETAVEE